MVFDVYICLLFEFCVCGPVSHESRCLCLRGLATVLPAMMKSKTGSDEASFPQVVSLRYFLIVMRKYMEPKKVIVESKILKLWDT